ncbi:MAG: hypothetical protein Q8K65_02610 [Alphaproteobacteria bacterium]|nr:hypothetical protein [Alphaproteobacteria bacterium]
MQDVTLAFPRACPEFARLSEEEVWAALLESDDSRVTVEVTRLVCGFWVQWRGYLRGAGLSSLPPELLHIATRCPIERVAVVIMIGYLESETGGVAGITRH